MTLFSYITKQFILSSYEFPKPRTVTQNPQARGGHLLERVLFLFTVIQEVFKIKAIATHKHLFLNNIQ